MTKSSQQLPDKQRARQCLTFHRPNCFQWTLRSHTHSHAQSQSQGEKSICWEVNTEQVKFSQVHLLLFTSVIINVSSYTRCYSAYSILKNPFHIWSPPIECQCITPNKESTQQQTHNHFTGWLRNRIKEKTFLHMWWSPLIPPIESQRIVHKEPVLSAVKVVV